MQHKIFIKHPLAIAPANNQLLQESAEIVNKAIIDNDPYAIVLMLSGGDDSITALLAAIMCGIKIDFIVHGVTGTGLPAVRLYVAEIAAKYGIKIIYADAGTAFEDYVMRKGFFGRGKDAHKYSYHILKDNPFGKAISKYIRKGVKGRKIILLNGIRVDESDNRADNFGDNPYRWQDSSPNNLWVNIIHWFTKHNCLELLAGEDFKRSPVAIELGRSGECNCGTMDSEADRIAAYKFDPVFGERMMKLRKAVVQKFGWDIGQQPNKKVIAEMKAANLLIPDFMPMCVGCKANKNYSLFKDDQL